MSIETDPNLELRPELPFPEPMPKHEKQVTGVAINEGTIAVSSLQEVVGAWKNHFKNSKRTRRQKKYIQAVLPFADANISEVDGSQIEVHKAAIQTAQEALPRIGSHLAEVAAERLNRKNEFRRSLGEWATKKVIGQQSVALEVRARSFAERRAENKVLNQLEKAKIKVVASELEDVVHGGAKKGKLDRRATRLSQKEAVRALKEARANGDITGEELAIRLKELARVKEYKDSRTQGKARRAAISAKRDIVTGASKPKTSVLRQGLELRLRTWAEQNTQAEPNNGAVELVATAVSPGAAHATQPEAVITPEAQNEPSAPVDWREKLKASNMQRFRKRIDAEVKTVKEQTQAANPEADFDRTSVLKSIREKLLPEYLGVTVDDLHDAEKIAPADLDELNFMLDMDWAELQSLVDEEPKPVKTERGRIQQPRKTAPRKATATPKRKPSKDEEERARRAVEENARRTALDR